MRLLCQNRLSTGARLLFFITFIPWISGCQNFRGIPGLEPIQVPSEYRQKVGLYVHNEPERFYYPGSSGVDISDLMALHMQQVLPFTVEGVLKEIFAEVEHKEPGPKVVFKSQDLVGYFEVKTANLRYDFPDPGAYNYRANVELLAEFKTLDHQPVWGALLEGEGVGFSNRDLQLSPFGREAATAVEEAFQNAVYELRNAVLKAPPLRQYFRLHSKVRASEEVSPSSPA